MSIKTTDFLALTDDLQEITNEVMIDKVAEMSTADMIFDIKDMVRRTYDLQVVHGTKGIEYVPDGSDYPRASSEEGDSITFTQGAYGVIVPITKQMRMFDLYDQITGLATSVTEEGMDKIDQSFADMLLKGFAATAYTDVYNKTVTPVGPDGNALFYATHSNGATGETYSNIITEGATVNPVMSRSAIVAERIRGLVYKNVNDLTTPIRLDTLIVPPSLEDAAERYLFSTQIPGEANNDINALKGKIKTLKIWERLESSSDGTDTSAYWFMADSSKVKNTMKAIFAQRPMLSAPDQVFSNKDWEYSFDYLYTRGFGWSPYLRGSNSTEA